MKTERYQADVLCIGGGIAGLMAAIRASEFGAKVIVVDKGNTARSGEARTGNDHFWCYIPEVHGSDIDAYIQECLLSQLGLFVAGLGKNVIRVLMERSFEIVKLWDSWGIPMKYQGRWEFAGHSFPGRLLTHLKYAGQDQKPILTREAIKKNVQIINRVMVQELLVDGNRVIGALGIDTRQDRWVEFQAKSIVLGTGAVARLYPNLTPGLIGNQIRPITLSGDGRAMAYRAGAEVADLEALNRHIGPKNFCRAGQATWIGIYKDAAGNKLGKYVDKMDRKYGDILPEVDKQIFARLLSTGKGPFYMDCTDASAEDIEYMRHWLVNEGNLGLVKHLDAEGVDLRKNPVEFQTYPIRGGGRINCNENTETTVKGLFAAGEEAFPTITSAAVFGWIAGEKANDYARKNNFIDIKQEQTHIDEVKALSSQIRDRQYGPDWKDANTALQNTLSDYAGLIRSKTMLEAGLDHLRRLKGKTLSAMRAGNRWELVRCLEVLNLYELGELVFLGALERKESRGLHQRTDFTYTDPLLNYQVLTIKKVNNQPLLKWKDLSQSEF
jgi:succinate dehydrogenase/fumarate reductase flavoprotein subunit